MLSKCARWRGRSAATAPHPPRRTRPPAVLVAAPGLRRWRPHTARVCAAQTVKPLAPLGAGTVPAPQAHDVTIPRRHAPVHGLRPPRPDLAAFEAFSRRMRVITLHPRLRLGETLAVVRGAARPSRAALASTQHDGAMGHFNTAQARHGRPPPRRADGRRRGAAARLSARWGPTRAPTSTTTRSRPAPASVVTCWSTRACSTSTRCSCRRLWDEWSEPDFQASCHGCDLDHRRLWVQRASMWPAPEAAPCA